MAGFSLKPSLLRHFTLQIHWISNAYAVLVFVPLHMLFLLPKALFSSETFSFFRAFFFFFSGCTLGIWSSCGQGSNPSCICNLHHSCSNARSLTHCAGLAPEPATPQKQAGSLTHCATLFKFCSRYYNYRKLTLYSNLEVGLEHVILCQLSFIITVLLPFCTPWKTTFGGWASLMKIKYLLPSTQ